MAFFYRILCLLPILILFLHSCEAANLTDSSSLVDAEGTTNTTAVYLSNDTAFAVCLYPTSSSYSLLNRLLYYVTLVVSLLSKGHLWLVTGALATAMTYSGTAAIHACLLAWRGPVAFEDLDLFALYAILGTACLVTVPLLNWSATLRRLGAGLAKREDDGTSSARNEACTRTIVVYWAFLVFIGYISMVIALASAFTKEPTLPNMEKVLCQAGTNASLWLYSSGNYSIRAIDPDFVEANHCSNPCDMVKSPSLFRQNNDLVLLDHTMALLWSRTMDGSKYDKLYKFIDFQTGFLDLTILVLLCVILQGFITACFGRQTPREIRDFLYIKLARRQRIIESTFLRKVRDWIARIIAFLSYLTAILMIIICPPLCILLVLSLEWFGHFLMPDSENMSAIGQWGPWAVVAQILFVTLVSRYHSQVLRHLSNARHWLLNLGRQRRHQNRSQLRIQRPQERFDLSPSHEANFESKVATNSVKTTLSTVNVKAEHTKVAQGRQTRQKLVSACRRLGPKLLSPLQRGCQSLVGEFKNFFQWCKDPAKVSIKAERLPQRISIAEAEEVLE